MNSVVAAVIALGALQAGAVWIAVRAIASVDPQTVPARLRHRMQWWQRHDRHTYAVCAMACAVGGLAEIASLLT